MILTGVIVTVTVCGSLFLASRLYVAWQNSIVPRAEAKVEKMFQKNVE